MSIELNVSLKHDYYSQRNNKIDPGISCQVTAMVAALDDCHISFPKDMQYGQQEDSLRNFIGTSDIIDAEYAKLFPDLYQKWINSGKNAYKSTHPAEIHPLLSYGTNLWLNGTRDQFTHFRWDLTLYDIIWELINNKPVVQSGFFLGRLHHIINTVGFSTNQNSIMKITDKFQIDLGMINYWIIDDSYGDFHSNYTIIRGDNIKMTPQEYMSIIKPCNETRKWGHLFSI